MFIYRFAMNDGYIILRASLTMYNIVIVIIYSDSSSSSYQESISVILTIITFINLILKSYTPPHQPYLYNFITPSTHLKHTQLEIKNYDIRFRHPNLFPFPSI